MLLDINAYVGHWPFKQLQYNTCDALLDRMNKFGVDVSAVSNLNGIFYKNTQSANKELYDEIKSNRRFRDRFVPFAVINPIYAGFCTIRFTVLESHFLPDLVGMLSSFKVLATLKQLSPLATISNIRWTILASFSIGVRFLYSLIQL